MVRRVFIFISAYVAILFFPLIPSQSLKHIIIFLSPGDCTDGGRNPGDRRLRHPQDPSPHRRWQNSAPPEVDIERQCQRQRVEEQVLTERW